MYISKITLENFKGFNGSYQIEFKRGVNFLVGNNNSGKSSVLESVDFVKNGLGSNSLNDVKTVGSNDVTVSIELRGDIKEAIKSNVALKKLDDFVQSDKDGEFLTMRRSSKVEEITQSGKNVTLDIKKLTFYHPSNKQFENPAGKDTTFSSLFEAQFVWADTNPDDVSDFGSTKICGRLLAAAIGDFKSTPQWEAFSDAHRGVFGEAEGSVGSKVKPLKNRIEQILADQYGEAKVDFNFSLPEPSSFIKSGNVRIDDGVDTDAKRKGTGMQRALALALIQAYADSITSVPDEELKKRPLLFFIDEPETFLHPIAQDRLLASFEKLSQDSQVFVTTHSPYLLKIFNKDTHTLHIFKKQDGVTVSMSSAELNMFSKSSPTWGEINYTAFGVVSVEFHNELYGFIQAKAISEDKDNYNIDNFEKYLKSNGCSTVKKWIEIKKGGSEKEHPEATLQTYVRNYIHHPENDKNDPYSPEELSQSIKAMIALL